MVASLFLQDLPLFSVCLFGEALPSFEMRTNLESPRCLGCGIYLEKHLENLLILKKYDPMQKHTSALLFA